MNNNLIKIIKKHLGVDISKFTQVGEGEGISNPENKFILFEKEYDKILVCYNKDKIKAISSIIVNNKVYHQPICIINGNKLVNKRGTSCLFFKDGKLKIMEVNSFKDKEEESENFVINDLMH